LHALGEEWATGLVAEVEVGPGTWRKVRRAADDHVELATGTPGERCDAEALLDWRIRTPLGFAQPAVLHAFRIARSEYATSRKAWRRAMR
jgi:hypothetical protein